MFVTVFTEIFRHRIVAEFSGERMAARETLDAKPDAGENAEALNGFVGKLRASRFEAAGAGEENGQVGFVAADGEESRANGEG